MTQSTHGLGSPQPAGGQRRSGRAPSPGARAGVASMSDTAVTGPSPLVSDGPPPPPPPPAGTSAAAAASRSRAARVRGPRRARLQVRHLNPWTVLKFSCVLAIALFFVWLIVIAVLYGVLDATGIIGKINDAVVTIQGGDAKAPIRPWVVFGAAALLGVVNIVLFIALSTVGSVVYNLCADLVGGVEVTLSERDG